METFRKDETYKIQSKMSHNQNKALSANKKMTFLIDHILQPDFGSAEPSTDTKSGFSKTTENNQISSPSAAAKYLFNNDPNTEKKSSEIINKTEKSKTDPSLPAWIFCTRYSDRPSSSGNLFYVD